MSEQCPKCRLFFRLKERYEKHLQECISTLEVVEGKTVWER